jgi:hypothetical protein
MSLDIRIKTVPHSDVRCDQCGDWHINNDGSIEVLVTDLNGNWESELAVSIHELLEAFMCKESGITDEDVTRFDLQFEQERSVGKQTLRAEAGDDERSPYRVPHQAATFVERAVTSVLGLDWETHDSAVIQ